MEQEGKDKLDVVQEDKKAVDMVQEDKKVDESEQCQYRLYKLFCFYEKLIGVLFAIFVFGGFIITLVLLWCKMLVDCMMVQ